MKFLKEVLSEDGQGSFSRVSSFLIVLGALYWITHLVRYNHAFPDFGGLALLIGTLYGINKASSIVQAARGDKIDPQ